MGPDWIDLIQWPAMLASLLAAWWVASQKAWRRKTGFWVFLLSNVLWVIWGVHSDAYALIVLQLALAVTNIRGVKKNDRSEPAADASSGGVA